MIFTISCTRGYFIVEYCQFITCTNRFYSLQWNRIFGMRLTTVLCSLYFQQSLYAIVVMEELVTKIVAVFAPSVL